MITGALFLNKNIILKDFFKNRFTRIFYPFIFFSIISAILFGIKIHIFYWYPLMLIGTLFAIPIINKFIQNSSENEIEYYILIFIVFSIAIQLFQAFKIEYALDMSFFITPVSYLILGYYLFKKDFNYSHDKILIISFALFIISSVLKIYTGDFFYSNEFHTYLDLSFLQIIQACSVFVFIKYLYSNNTSVIFSSLKRILEKDFNKKFILSVSKSSYGMYLIQNPIIFKIFKPYLKHAHLTGTQSLLVVILMIFGVFIFSWILTLILSKLPIINKVSGYA